MKKEIIKESKELIIELLIIIGILNLLKGFWDILEMLFDGGIQVSMSDTIIAVILTWLIWLRISKWIETKDSEVEL